MRYLRLPLLIAMCLIVAGCPKKGPSDDDRIKDFNTAGWVLFESGSFADALVEFEDAIALDGDSSTAESFVGAGWSTLMLQDTTYMANLIATLPPAVADTAWEADAWTCMSIAYFSVGQYSNADSLAALALTSDSSYIFTHRPEVRWEDLHVIQGQSRFILVDYFGAWTAVSPLLAGTAYAALDTIDTTTWIINGVTYTRFEEIIALAINYLTEQFRD